jgi:hypothetical protein
MAFKPLSALELSDFDEHLVWEAGGPDHCDDEQVSPVIGKQTVRDGESNLWVRFEGSLADGTIVRGIAMAEADPATLLLWSFFVEGQWRPLHLPPAPAFVLEHTGPEPFAQALGRRLECVFPIRMRTEVKAESTGAPITALIAPVVADGAS